MKSFLAMVATLVIVGSAAAFWIIHLKDRPRAAAPATAAPASQTRNVKESDLNIVTLTSDAEKRLALRTEKVARKQFRRALSMGGEAMLPPGASITVNAPIAATVKSAATPAPGLRVKRGQEMMSLLPLLTNEARTSLATALVDAEGQIKNADVQLKAATISLERARQLLAEQATSKRVVDEAQAAFDLAQKTLDAARARRELLASTLEGAGAGSATAIKIVSPANGIVRAVHVAPDQLVGASSPLFEVIDPATLWLRVGVYVGDIAQVDGGAAAALAGEAPVELKPVAAPPTASSATATRDLYYQLDNASSDWAPGQRIIVELPLKAEAPALAVPWSAVVHDVSGGAWVYENTAPHQYVRRRIQVARVVDGQAVLSSGPAVGTSIVTQGVAEIWGREMGFGK